ncbi:hypothetical protein [Deinococcus multiflagellatus]|uniref:hypothetical protein n=1 Tax=Deinococcus multiflagellatus TaxID=1656887 RepID=UPI001CCF15D6|nr:hypothetical protein [Deinococcus multiflagellatus]MBZ9714319.1 hypothetical protein [Deinococcus multiflagellatus]
MTDPLAALSAALEEDPQAALVLYGHLPPVLQAQAGEAALALGRPRLALTWAPDPLVRAAAALRLGDAARAQAELAALPDGPRVQVLQARAAHQLARPGAPAVTLAARAQARAAGDSAALVAAAVLLAEQEYPQATSPYAPLRTLAEGLKVAELSGQSADPHLLAVLAHVQARLNPRKAQATAHKALDRSAPRSPARVLALLALERAAEAQAEADAGELAPVWWAAFQRSPAAAQAIPNGT